MTDMHFSEHNNLSAFLQRHQDLFQDKNLLICGQLQALSLEPLLQNPNSTYLVSDYCVFNKLKTQNLEKSRLHFGFKLDDSTQKYDALLVFMPKAKQEAALWFNWTLPLLKSNAEIFVIGENRGGINATPKLLQTYTSGTKKIDSARHCSLFYASLLTPVPTPSLHSQLHQYTLQHTANINPLTISALSGVFSADELDEGTQLLLDNLPSLHGEVLDVGCGAGIIGASICQRMPDVKMTMTDVNALALFSATETLNKNHLSANVIASDMFSDVIGKFDFIISNPPFHSGLNTNYEATERLLRQAPAYLKHHGQLFLVANKFLRYEPILNEVFHSVSVIKENARFKIIRAM